MTTSTARWTRKPSGSELVGQVGAVLADLPRFLTAPLYRRRHLRWGATSEEVASSLPGDEFLPSARFVCTRAVTIAAPPAAVWPWLVQVGCGRAGWYSHDLLDNLARPSAREIVPELQHLETGQRVPMAPGVPTESNSFRVEGVETDRWLLWRKPDSTWAWRFTAMEEDRTRLVTRVHAAVDRRHPATAALGIVLMEFGDFAMMRRMLLTIAERAGSLHRTGAVS
jgi:hypothetical protein